MSGMISELFLFLAINQSHQGMPRWSLLYSRHFFVFGEFSLKKKQDNIERYL